MTIELPPRLTASTGLDALSHAIEAYSVEWKNDFSDALAIQAIKLIFTYLSKAVEEGRNLLYREKMHNAATMAGIAFGNSQIGGAHALAHSAGDILNIPHDPRAFVGTAILYLTSPRGACHNNGDAWLVQQGLSFPEIEIDNLPENRFENKGIIKQMIRLQSYRQLYNTMTICQYYNPPVKIIADLLGLAIEKELKAKDLILIGDRIFALKRLLNIKLSWKPELEKMPEIMMKKLDGPTEGNIPEYKFQLKKWYELRKYDQATGKPNYEELERLGLLKYEEIFQIAI